MVNRERVFETFLALARTDSPSFHEEKVRDLILERLKKLELEVEEDDAGMKIGGTCGNLTVQLKGDPSIAPIVLMAHMDTVEPSTNKEPVFEDGVFRTNGKTILGGDDHAGVTVLLEFITLLHENRIKHGDITILFTVAEEKGLLGAKNYAFHNIHAKYGFVFDDGGPIGTYAYQAPSQQTMAVDIYGKAAHAGVEPEKGISAIQIFARAVNAMKLGRISDVTTANVGVVSGGVATNIIPDTVRARCEARSLDANELHEQVSHMKNCFMEAADSFSGKVHIETKMEYETFCIDEDHPITRILQKAATDGGYTLRPEKSGGGSDTNILNANGIPSVNLSVGMDKVHTLDEVVRLEDIMQATRFLLYIVQNVEE